MNTTDCRTYVYSLSIWSVEVEGLSVVRPDGPPFHAGHLPEHFGTDWVGNPALHRLWLLLQQCNLQHTPAAGAVAAGYS
jgi:hypothetical protein